MTMSERSEDVANGVRSSKIIVKESSLQVNSSSRIYYYGGASVPFLWETRPGTPKHSLFSESFRLPPLTPPPSYYSSFSGNKLSKVRPKQTRFVKTFFNGNHHVSRPGRLPRLLLLLRLPRLLGLKLCIVLKPVTFLARDHTLRTTGGGRDRFLVANINVGL
ncbi:hypothetical protein Bca101_017907 [Brassica carinata]